MIKVSEEAVKAGGEIGANLLTSMLTPVLLTAYVAESVFREDAGTPVTDAILTTSLGLGKAAGEFITREGPDLAVRVIVGDLIGTTLLLPGQDDGGCE